MIWKIESLLARIEGNNKIVERAIWRVSHIEDGIEAFVSGWSDFQYQESTSFTAYESLTEAEVLSWVHAILGDQRQKHEAEVMRQWEVKRRQPIVLPLPWLYAPAANDILIDGNVNDTIESLP